MDYDSFEHFWKTNEYNDIDCLLLMLLSKVAKEKDDFRV